MFYFVKESVLSKTVNGKDYLSLVLVDSSLVETKCFLWECSESLQWHVLHMNGLPVPNAKGFISFKPDAIVADMGLLQESESLMKDYSQWLTFVPMLPSYERFRGAVVKLLEPWVVADTESVEAASLSARQKVVLRLLAELPELYEAYRNAYGGRKQHHAYKGGLVQHTFEMLCFAFGLRKWWPWKVDMFVLTLAILYHDWGKVDEYKDETAEYTEQLVLWPHPVASTFKFKELYGDLLSEGLLQRILHAILSHNGRKEWMTASLPATIEAFILSELDLMSAWGSTISNSISMDYITGMDRRVVTSPVPEE